MSVCNKL